MKSERRIQKGQALAGLAGFWLALPACAGPIDPFERERQDEPRGQTCPADVRPVCRLTSFRTNFFTGHRVLVYECPDETTLVVLVTPKGPNI